MRVMAVDPGTTESAWVLLVDGTVKAHGKVPNTEIDRGFFAVADAPVAIEMIQSFGMAVGAEVFETVFWIGRMFELARAAGCDVRRVFRGTIKTHLCHSMRAKDPNIRQALIDRLGPQGTKKAQGPTYGLSGDRWAALAVAVTASDRWADPGAFV